jgi:hypothetical protein
MTQIFIDSQKEPILDSQDNTPNPLSAVPVWKLREYIIRSFVGQPDKGLCSIRPDPKDWDVFERYGKELVRRDEAPIEYVRYLLDEKIEFLEHDVSAQDPYDSNSWYQAWFSAAQELLELKNLYEKTQERENDDGIDDRPE